MSVFSFCDDTPIFPKNNESYWIAPSASVVGRVVIKNNVSVWYGAVVRGDNEWIHIGEATNIQDNAVLHSDIGSPLSIGKECTIGHQAVIHGCTIEEGCLIGMGAIILNDAFIGKNSLVGAGSLVTQGKNFPKESLVMGNPARCIRSLTSDEIKSIKQSSRGYVMNWKRHTHNTLL